MANSNVNPYTYNLRKFDDIDKTKRKGDVNAYKGLTLEEARKKALGYTIGDSSIIPTTNNADTYKDELLGGGVTALGELQKNIINGTTKAPTNEQTTNPYTYNLGKSDDIDKTEQKTKQKGDVNAYKGLTLEEARKKALGYTVPNHNVQHYTIGYNNYKGLTLEEARKVALGDTNGLMNANNAYQNLRQDSTPTRRSAYSMDDNGHVSVIGGTQAPTTEQTTTPLSTPNAYSYYDTERAYQMNNLQKQRQTAIDNAVLAYQRALNPYGVEAQGLASAGMTANGGYGQRMKTNRFNAYAQGVNNAENTYQQGVADLDRSLAYQKYADQKEEKANAYTNAANEMAAQQNIINYAKSLGKSVVEWKGKNIKNVDAVKAHIRSIIPTISDAELAAAISYITKD